VPNLCSGATVNQIRLPERADTDEGSVFPVKLKTLTGGVCLVRYCNAATTVESLKHSFAEQNCDIDHDQIILIWAQTQLINGNTLASYSSDYSNKAHALFLTLDARREDQTVCAAGCHQCDSYRNHPRGSCLSIYDTRSCPRQGTSPAAYTITSTTHGYCNYTRHTQKAL
jgi:hypothetical protein